MKSFLFLAALLLFSCSKEDDSCTEYFMITESNKDEALDKCSGYANSYPKMTVISKQSIGCLTSSELKSARVAEKTTSVEVCTNVFAKVSITIR